jgi:hypothetical protein
MGGALSDNLFDKKIITDGALLFWDGHLCVHQGVLAGPQNTSAIRFHIRVEPAAKRRCNAFRRASIHRLGHAMTAALRSGNTAPGSPYSLDMCRNITTLRGLQPGATQEEIEAAARQYVRKVSGVTSTSKNTEVAFEAAVQRIAEATTVLLSELPPRQQPPPTLPPLRRLRSSVT